LGFYSLKGKNRLCLDSRCRVVAVVFRSLYSGKDWMRAIPEVILLQTFLQSHNRTISLFAVFAQIHRIAHTAQKNGIAN
jgi:hypothetical protein